MVAMIFKDIVMKADSLGEFYVVVKGVYASYEKYEVMRVA